MKKPMKAQEVAKLLRVTKRTVLEWIRSGDLPAAELGRRAGYRISEQDLQAFWKKRGGDKLTEEDE